MLDLVLPVECGGCGAARIRWCAACTEALRVRPDQPHLITPRVDPGVPVFALGRYAGLRGHAIVALKERGRADLVAPLAATLRHGLDRLTGWGIVEPGVTLVPAPTRLLAARRRGGDPVTRLAQATGHPVVAALRTKAFTRDSVGLSVSDRQRNVAGRIKLTGAPTVPVVVVDDIVTTGATVTESVGVLQTAGVHVLGVLALAHA